MARRALLATLLFAAGAAAAEDEAGAARPEGPPSEASASGRGGADGAADAGGTLLDDADAGAPLALVPGGAAAPQADGGVPGVAPPVEEWKGLPNAFNIPGTGAWLHVGGFAHLDVIYDPNFVLDSGAAGLVDGAFELRAPDLVLRFLMDRGPLRLMAGGVARYLRFRETSGALTEAVGLGAIVELRIKPHQRLTLWAEAVGGQGIGGYRGAADLAVDRSGALAVVPILGGLVGVSFNWLPTLRSTALVSVGGSPFQASTQAEETKVLLYSSANLQWFPVERVMVGFEVLYGQRSGALAGGDPAQAHAVRLQGAMRVSLP